MSASNMISSVTSSPRFGRPVFIPKSERLSLPVAFPPQWVGGSTNSETELKPPVLTHRVYGLMWPEDPSNSYKPGMEFFVQRLQQECGVTKGRHRLPAD